MPSFPGLTGKSGINKNLSWIPPAFEIVSQGLVPRRRRTRPKCNIGNNDK